jgi:hypothetical protein
MRTQKEQIEEAKHCIEVMKQIGTFRNHKIGIARYDAGLTLTKGYVVLYREEKDGTLTTEHACNKEWIEENLKKGNLNTTGSTCVNVPRSFIIPLCSKYEWAFANT